ncbi:Fc.00g084960.m01.CDS01 [Cosmosporella sp. VM-42]
MTVFTKLLVSLFVLCSSSTEVRACAFHGGENHLATIDFDSLIADNIAARSLRRRETSSTRIALTNVRVFDGAILQPPSTVFIDGDRIGQPCSACEACASADVLDAQGMTLLPGLIDSHVHPDTVDHLVELTRFGVTSAVNAFCPDPRFCASLRDHTGLTSLLMASFIATSPNSTHAKMVGPQGAPFLINNSSQIPSFIAQQVADGADFIKIIGSAPQPGLSQEEQIELVKASHNARKQVVLHTSSYLAFLQGLVAGADQIHHSTLDVPVDDHLISMFKREKTVLCPTLTMMRNIVDQLAPPNSSFASASETVRRLHRAGVPIIVGTDSNMQALAPAKVEFGSSLHDELENFVAAGFSPVEALNAATSLPAKYFGLTDRGIIKSGMRADLLLVKGDPTMDITATRNIARIWVGGVQFEG